MGARILLRLCATEIQAQHFASRARWWSASAAPLATSTTFIANSSIEAAIHDALAALQQLGARIAGADLHVELGMRYARVGLLGLGESFATRLGFQAQEAYVNAWVQEVLQLAPEEQVIRWQVLRNPRHVLVSCVDLNAYTALSEVARIQRLRFTSCIPALIGAIRDARSERRRTLVWTEGGQQRREGLVQLVRIGQGEPVGMWRGWIPPNGAPHGADRSVDGALRRFEAQHPADQQGQELRIRWPALATTSAQG